MMSSQLFICSCVCVCVCVCVYWSSCVSVCDRLKSPVSTQGGGGEEEEEEGKERVKERVK